MCELGAGCGLAGIAFAKLGYHVMLTDIGPVLTWLRENVEANLSAAERNNRVYVEEYYWGTLFDHRLEEKLKPPFGRIIIRVEKNAQYLGNK